jgi:serine/threonine protein kinase
LDSNLHVQIADFGLTRLEEATQSRLTALTIRFAAPELLMGGLHEDGSHPLDDVPEKTSMSDVYAFGCLYYEVGDNEPADAMLLLRFPRFISIICRFQVDKTSRFFTS